MISLRLPLAIAALAFTALVSAAEPPTSPARGELWRRQLGDEAALGVAIEQLHGALETRNLPELVKLINPGSLKLQIASLSMPPTLCGALQARVLMADYFRVTELEGLRVSQLRLAESGLSARVALDLIGAPLAPGRPDRRRIVARIQRSGVEEPWRVAELRCP